MTYIRLWTLGSCRMTASVCWRQFISQLLTTITTSCFALQVVDSLTPLTRHSTIPTWRHTTWQYIYYIRTLYRLPMRTNWMSHFYIHCVTFFVVEVWHYLNRMHFCVWFEGSRKIICGILVSFRRDLEQGDGSLLLKNCVSRQDLWFSFHHSVKQRSS